LFYRNSLCTEDLLKFDRCLLHTFGHWAPNGQIRHDFDIVWLAAAF
jgi:hypothetical protein